MPNFHRAHCKLSQTLAGLLLACVLLTQWLGVMHRTWHAEGQQRVSGHAHQLFAHDAGGEQCRLLDGLAQQDGLLPAALLLIVAVASAAGADKAICQRSQTQLSFYQARAPPAIL